MPWCGGRRCAVANNDGNGFFAERQERSLRKRIIANKWLVGSLIVAIVLVFALTRRGRWHSSAAPARVAIPSEAAAIVAQRTNAPKPPKPLVDDSGTVEICGVGKVPIDSGDPLALNQRVGALTKGAGARWLSALQDSSDLRARVAGLLLEGRMTGDEPMQPASEQTRDALVQLAVGAGDPAVYAMAVSICSADQGAPADGTCQQISLRRWAQLDPDNAVPWLLLAGQARERQDRAAEADAFSQAALAHKVDSYNYSLYAFSESEMPNDVTPLERFYLSVELVGHESAMQAPQYSIASRHCSADALQDADVRQQCNALAELLVTRGTTMLDLGAGTHIGALAGWSAQRVNALTQKKMALMQALMQETPSANEEMWTCDGVRRGNAYMSQMAQSGELGAARDALDRSGETVPALAQKQQDFIDKLIRDASERQQQEPSEPAQ